MTVLTELGFTLLVWFVVAAPTTLLVWLAWASGPRATQSQITSNFTWNTHWTGWDVLGIVALFYAAPAIMQLILQSILGTAGLREATQLATDLVTFSANPSLVMPTIAQSEADFVEYRYDLSVRGAWASLLAFPLQISLFFQMRRLEQSQSAQVDSYGWRRAWIFAGMVMIVSSIVVLVINWLARMIINWMTGTDGPSHSLLELLYGRDPVIEWSLLLISALVMAPVLEEILFRGLLLVWASRDNERSHILFGVTFLLTAIPPVLNVFVGENAEWSKMVFVMVLGLPYFLTPSLFLASTENETLEEKASTTIDSSRQSRFRAVYVTALLFAIGHHWPSCIALFFFGCVLGWMVIRSKHLLPAIICHSLFNGIACAQVVLGRFLTF